MITMNIKRLALTVGITLFSFGLGGATAYYLNLWNNNTQNTVIPQFKNPESLPWVMGPSGPPPSSYYNTEAIPE